MHETGGDESLHGDARVLVDGEEGVEDAVADLVADLVRVTLGHGFRGEQAQR